MPSTQYIASRSIPESTYEPINRGTEQNAPTAYHVNSATTETLSVRNNESVFPKADDNDQNSNGKLTTVTEAFEKVTEVSGDNSNDTSYVTDPPAGEPSIFIPSENSLSLHFNNLRA